MAIDVDDVCAGVDDGVAVEGVCELLGAVGEADPPPEDPPLHARTRHERATTAWKRIEGMAANYINC